MRLLRALLVVAALEVTTTTHLRAQRSGVVGTVSDTLGAALGGVQVELSGTDYGSITNVHGEFRLLKVKPGPYTIFMRRIGFGALSMKLEIKNGEPMELDFELTPTLVRLATFSVKAPYMSEKLKRVGFEDRQNMSGLPASHFITRADLERRNPMSLTHMLERQGGRVRNCVDATVWIDGIPPAAALEQPQVGPFSRNSSIRSAARSENSNSMRYRPLENIPVRTVDGMEIFASLSEVPTEFRAGGNAMVNGKCVILIWTREGNR